MAIYPAGAWVDALHPSLGGNSVFSFQEILKYFFRKYKSELHIFLEMLSGFISGKVDAFQFNFNKIVFYGSYKNLIKIYPYQQNDFPLTEAK